MHKQEHQQNKNKTDQLKPLSMDDAIEELLKYSLLQGGDGVWKRAPYHQPLQRNLQYVFDQNGGTKQRTNMEQWLDKDAKEGTIQPPETASSTCVESITMQWFQFNTREIKYAWLEHHPKCTVKRGKCRWEQCPWLSGDNLTDRNRPVRASYHTYYRYIQCSMQIGKPHYFCNDFIFVDTRNCHDLYHKKYHGKTIDR